MAIYKDKEDGQAPITLILLEVNFKWKAKLLLNENTA